MSPAKVVPVLTRRLIRKALAESRLKQPESAVETLEPTELIAVRDFWQNCGKTRMRLEAMVNAEKGMSA